MSNIRHMISVLREFGFTGMSGSRMSSIGCDIAFGG